MDLDRPLSILVRAHLVLGVAGCAPEWAPPADVPVAAAPAEPAPAEAAPDPEPALVPEPAPLPEPPIAEVDAARTQPEPPPAEATPPAERVDDARDRRAPTCGPCCHGDCGPEKLLYP